MRFIKVADTVNAHRVYDVKIGSKGSPHLPNY